ncbi:MAG: hypothetical protein QGG74_05770 [Phycisphaerales bacterium]|jgi:Na+/proline symporter|nr:hypothetical protein [Phycisphaerales bacterium]
MNILILCAFLFPILPLVILGAKFNDNPGLGAILGLIVGVFAGALCCAPLVLLDAIKSEVACIADAIENQSG